MATIETIMQDIPLSTDIATQEELNVVNLELSSEISSKADKDFVEKNFVALSGDQILSGQLSTVLFHENPNYGKIILSNDDFSWMFYLTENPLSNIRTTYDAVRGNWEDGKFVSAEIFRGLTPEIEYHYDLTTQGGGAPYGTGRINLSAPGITYCPYIAVEAYEVPSEYAPSLTSIEGEIDIQTSDAECYKYTQFNMGATSIGGEDGFNQVTSYFENARDSNQYSYKNDKFALVSELPDYQALEARVTELEARLSALEGN